MDLLTDVLSTLRLRGTVYFHADFHSPWGMDIKGGQFANFHIVTAGQCWVSWENQDGALLLNEGDLVVFPHGQRHIVCDNPEHEALPAEEMLAKSRSGDDNRVHYGGDGHTTSLICGHFEYDRSLQHPLLSALPTAIHLSAQDTADADWVNTVARMTISESSSSRQGSSAIVDRLAEILLVQLIRSYMDQISDEEGFLAALGDQAIGAALKHMHGQPAHPWDVQQLAKLGGLSRSVFASRFSQQLGVGPMQYLTNWRMQQAAELLVNSRYSTAQIAERIGYASEWSFAKAYKRAFGVGPGAYRRRAAS
jgi:AraC family transcriptional activator of mtrCDE